jgi:hypothetical protein
MPLLMRPTPVCDMRRLALGSDDCVTFSGDSCQVIDRTSFVRPSVQTRVEQEDP